MEAEADHFGALYPREAARQHEQEQQRWQQECAEGEPVAPRGGWGLVMPDDLSWLPRHPDRVDPAAQAAIAEALQGSFDWGEGLRLKEAETYRRLIPHLGRLEGLVVDFTLAVETIQEERREAVATAVFDPAGAAWELGQMMHRHQQQGVATALAMLEQNPDCFCGRGSALFEQLKHNIKLCGEVPPGSPFATVVLLSQVQEGSPDDPGNMHHCARYYREIVAAVEELAGCRCVAAVQLALADVHMDTSSRLTAAMLRARRALHMLTAILIPALCSLMPWVWYFGLHQQEVLTGERSSLDKLLQAGAARRTEAAAAADQAVLDALIATMPALADAASASVAPHPNLATNPAKIFKGAPEIRCNAALLAASCHAALVMELARTAKRGALPADAYGKAFRRLLAAMQSLHAQRPQLYGCQLPATMEEALPLLVWSGTVTFDGEDEDAGVRQRSMPVTTRIRKLEQEVARLRAAGGGSAAAAAAGGAPAGDVVAAEEAAALQAAMALRDQLLAAKAKAAANLEKVDSELRSVERQLRILRGQAALADQDEAQQQEQPAQQWQQVQAQQLAQQQLEQTPRGTTRPPRQATPHAQQQRAPAQLQQPRRREPQGRRRARSATPATEWGDDAEGDEPAEKKARATVTAAQQAQIQRDLQALLAKHDPVAEARAAVVKEAVVVARAQLSVKEHAVCNLLEPLSVYAQGLAAYTAPPGVPLFLGPGDELPEDAERDVALCGEYKGPSLAAPAAVAVHRAMLRAAAALDKGKVKRDNLSDAQWDWLERTAALGGPGGALAAVAAALRLTAGTANCTGRAGVHGVQRESDLQDGSRSYKVRRQLQMLNRPKVYHGTMCKTLIVAAVMADLIVVLQRRFRLRLGHGELTRRMPPLNWPLSTWEANGGRMLLHYANLLPSLVKGVEDDCRSSPLEPREEEAEAA